MDYLKLNNQWHCAVGFTLTSDTKLFLLTVVKHTHIHTQYEICHLLLSILLNSIMYIHSETELQTHLSCKTETTVH